MRQIYELNYSAVNRWHFNTERVVLIGSERVELIGKGLRNTPHDTTDKRQPMMQYRYIIAEAQVCE